MPLSKERDNDTVNLAIDIAINIWKQHLEAFRELELLDRNVKPNLPGFEPVIPSQEDIGVNRYI